MHLLKLSIILECEDCEWDSNYSNHRSVISFLDWYQGHRGVILK